VKRPLASGLLLAGALAAGFALAEAPSEVQLLVHPSATRATVGDRIVVQVEVKHPPGVSFDPPAPLPGEGTPLNLESIKMTAADPKAPKELFYFQAQVFQTGAAQIPSFQVKWQKAGGESGTATSQPVSVEIVSVLKGEQDKPADLKPPAEIPAPPIPWL
jgi:hypothetical protein